MRFTETVLETYTYGVKAGSQRSDEPQLLTALVAPPPSAPPPPPEASYWRSKPLANRLRAIRLSLVGYVYITGSVPKSFFNSLLKLREKILYLAL